MNFDPDDPLAGILSDGSDDSFFDDDILGKKKPVKKNSTPIAEKKNALFDLDGTTKPVSKDNVLIDKQTFGTTIQTGVATLNTKVGVDVDEIKPKSPSLLRSTITKDPTKVQQVASKIKFTDINDISRSPGKSKLTTSVDTLNLLDELSIEPKKEISKPLEKGKSSQSLLDDILGGSTTKLTTSQKKPQTPAKRQDFDLDSILSKSESKQSLTLHKNVLQKPYNKPDTPKEPQVRQKSSDDWLGLFQEKDEDAEDNDETDMPTWLVGVDSKKKKNAVKTTKTEGKLTTSKGDSKSEVVDSEEKQHEVVSDIITQKSAPNTTGIALSSKLEVPSEDVTMESAALYLQQQESQIMVALQLKAQDEKLAAMQMRQKESQRVHREAAQAQREQLDSLLQRQAEHRRQMQAIIGAHQERITQRIKSLLGTNKDDEQEAAVADGEFETFTEQRPSPYMKEKEQLLQLIQSLQENHNKEIDLMETSYRRQIAFIEVSFNQAEERMKDESEKLVKFYTEKISWMDEHHQTYRKLTEDNLTSLMERNKAENHILQQQHLDNIKVLQEHHTALMENVKSAVKQEQVLIKDSASFSSELNEILTDVKDNNAKCQALVQNMETLTHNTQQNIEKSVQMRETQIYDMMLQLKTDRENFEKEKAENKDLLHILEARLKQMTTMIEDESAALKQKKMEFEFEKATFSKQTEFAKNILKKQDEEMKTLKEDIQKEYQEKNSKIEDEKSIILKDSALIAKEKAQVQSLKLDLERKRAELQAQLEEVTTERSKLHIQKQELHVEEQRLLAKGRELDLLAKNAMDKQAEADKKYAEAEFAQHKYEERIRKIQEHVVSLNMREKQIAKDKVVLSRERLSMHNEKKQLESRQQCSLCRSAQYNDLAYNLPDSYTNHRVSRDYSTTPINVEQEIAQLMGRTLKSRLAGVNGNFQERDSDAHEIDSAQVMQYNAEAYKDFLDPQFMMLRLDVQQVISNLDQSKKESVGQNEDQN